MPSPPSVEPILPNDSTEDVLSLLSDDTDDTPTPKPPVKEPKPTKDDVDDKEDKEDKEDKTDDLEDDKKDEDDELDTEDEDKLDLKEDKIEIDAPPRKKELLKLYPDIFTKVPYLEKMIYRDKQYQEMFGSFDDARESHEKAQALDEFENKLMAGDPSDIFTKVKESDPKAFGKIVKNLMPTLANVDRNSYLEITSDIAKRIIMHLDAVGKQTKDDELQATALAVAKFIFPGGFEPPKDEAAVPEKDSELAREREQFMQERLQTASTELQSKVTNTLKNTVLEYIDPNDQMTPFVKKNAVREALEDLDQTLNEDSLFRRQLDRLWAAAAKDKFNRASMDKIRSIYLGKAKQLLPTSIKKARKEALKGIEIRSRRKDEDNDETPRRGNIPAGRSAPKDRSSGSGKNQLKPGESVMDFLSRD